MTKTYGQTATLASTDFTTSGLVNSDSVSSVSESSTGAVATADVVGSPYAIIAPGDRLGPDQLHDHLCQRHPDGDPGGVDDHCQHATQDLRQTATFAGTAFTTTGLVNSDTVSSVTETSTGAAATADVAGSPYAIIASGAVGTGLTELHDHVCQRQPDRHPGRR